MHQLSILIVPSWQKAILLGSLEILYVYYFMTQHSDMILLILAKFIVT